MDSILGLLLLSAVALQAGANPLFGCDGTSMFIADDQSLCVFYQCAAGIPFKFACAKGSRVPSYLNKTNNDPCTVKVKKNMCNRCNVTDDPIPGATVDNQCAYYQPCATRPGCTCRDQVKGYFCDCPLPVTPVAPTPAQVVVPLCTENICQNNGTCYSLYKNSFCNCKPPWTGKFCEVNVCSSMVCENGFCTSDNYGAYCQCERCFTGACCDTILQDASCKNCSHCIVGSNCNEVRYDLCECNPCADNTSQCSPGIYRARNRTCIKAPSTASDSFTLMFEDNVSNPPLGLEIYVAAAGDDNGTRYVTVDAPLGALAGCPYSESALIPSGVVHKFNVSTCLKHTFTGRGDFGIRIREANGSFVNVYCINRATFSADGWLAIPDTKAGTKFVTISYSPIITASQFSIVAISNDTTVQIYLSNSSDVAGSTVGTVLSVKLNAYETYQVQSSKTGLPKNDLSGTVITSSKPIHVYSGEARAWVGPGPDSTDYNYSLTVDASAKSRDNLCFECISVETWGTTYAIMTLSRSDLGYQYTTEVGRIAGTTTTQCSIYSTSGGPLNPEVITLNAANFFIQQFFMNGNNSYFIECSQPVMIAEITQSSLPKYPGATISPYTGAAQYINDPSMIFVPAIASYTNFYKFVPPTFSLSGGPYAYTVLRIIARDTDYQGILVNGNSTSFLVARKQWQLLPVANAGSDENHPVLYGAIFNIDSLMQTSIVHPDSKVNFMCIVEGFDDRESYGIALGASINFLRNVTLDFVQSHLQAALIIP